MVDMPGMTAELHDQAGEKQGDRYRLPDGCQAHIADPGPDGWRIVAVWESPEKLQQYIENKLRPAHAEPGIAGPSKVVTWGLYDLLRYGLDGTKQQSLRHLDSPYGSGELDPLIASR